MIATYTIGLLQASAYRKLRMRTKEYLSKHSITPNEWAVLGMIKENTSVRLSGISKALHIKPASASEIIEHLTDRKLIKKTPNKDDRRAKDIVLTKKGANFIKKTEPELRQHMRPLLQNVSPADVLSYLKVLESINKSDT